VVVRAAVARTVEALAERTAHVRLTHEADVGTGTARALAAPGARIEVRSEELPLAARVVLATAEQAERILRRVGVVVLQRGDVASLLSAVAVDVARARPGLREAHRAEARHRHRRNGHGADLHARRLVEVEAGDVEVDLAGADRLGRDGVARRD